MTHEEIRAIAQEAADRAVSDCLLKLGINTENPSDVIEFQHDLAALRNMASFFGDLKTKGAMAAWLFVLTAVLGTVWLGIKASLH